MDAAVQAELDKLKELIINAMPVAQIYLFGSYAYGTPHRDSDLDLYVVLKDDNPIRDLDAGSPWCHAPPPYLSKNPHQGVNQ